LTPALWSLAGVALFCVAVFGSPLRQELGRTPLHIGLFLPTALLLGTLPAYLTRRLSAAFRQRTGRSIQIVYAVLSIPGVLSTVAVPMPSCSASSS